jgi:TolB-like protein/DNA-binding SARP family transcriptional activator/Tfp pilus assembly protein PilF
VAVTLSRQWVRGYISRNLSAADRFPIACGIMFSLKLFGGVSLSGDGGHVAGPAAQRRRLALLALLAAAPEGGVSREKLIGYLWPETDPEQARRFLADSVYSVRKALGQRAIVTLADNLRLDPEVIRSDAAEFRGALSRGERREAVTLYEGPFLDGFFVPDTPEFERWAEAERERHARQFARTLETLAEEREREGDLREAVEWWRRLAAQDPYSSRVALRLMQALEATGDPGAALQHARAHEALLGDVLEIEPDAEVVALAVRLLQARPGTGKSTLRATPERVRDEGPEESSVAEADEEEFAAESDGAAIRSGGLPVSRPARWRGWGAPAALGLVAVAIGVLIFGVVTAVERNGLDRPLYSEEVAAQSTPTADTLSIAVLPFMDLSPDGNHEFFSDGMADELIHGLARVEGLRVTARTSAFSFKGQNVPVSEIARRLQVGYIVEGSVRRGGERVRISVQLIDAGTGFPIWSQVYDRQISDIFAIQQEISRAIVAALRVQLEDVGGAQVRLAQRLPASVEAYEFYLRGLHLLKSGASRDALPRAIDLLEKAVGADPSYAAAHGMLASAYGLQAHFLPGPQHEALAKARIAAQRAVELDSTRSEAWEALGNIAFAHDFEWDAAERHFRRAVALDPSSTFARVALALCLHAQGRFDEALAEAQTARAADPLAPAVSTILDRILVNARQPDQAIHYLQEALQLSPPSRQSRTHHCTSARSTAGSRFCPCEHARCAAATSRGSAPRGCASRAGPACGCSAHRRAGSRVRLPGGAHRWHVAS